MLHIPYPHATKTPLSSLPPYLQSFAQLWETHSAPPTYASQTAFKLTTDSNNPTLLHFSQTLFQPPFEISARFFFFPSSYPRLLFDSKRHHSSAIPLFLNNSPFEQTAPTELNFRTFLTSSLWQQTIHETYLTHRQLETLCQLAIEHLHNLHPLLSPGFSTQHGPAHWTLVQPFHPDFPPLTTLLTGYSNTTFNDRPCPFLLHLAHMLPPYPTLNQTIPFYTPTSNTTPFVITGFSPASQDCLQHYIRTQPSFCALILQLEERISHMLSC